MKTDALIQSDVISELKWEPSIDAAKIGVSVRDGIVTLDGNVDSFVEKLAAERVASHVSGVKAVAQGADSVKILALSGRPALVVHEFRLQGKVEITVEFRQPVRQQAGLSRLECPMPIAGFARGPVARLSASVTLGGAAPLRAIFCPTHNTTVDRTGLY